MAASYKPKPKHSHAPYKAKGHWKTDRNYSVDKFKKANLRKWLRRKNRTASRCLHEFMKFRSNRPTPRIALCTSGGGLRASYGARYFTKILAEEDLWESIVIWAGLSGSTWFMGDYLVNGSQFAWSRQKEPKLELSDLLPKKPEKWNSLNDAFLGDYARVLGNAYFQNYRPSKWYFSDYFPRSFSSPFPIFASIDNKDRWYSINPLETKRVDSTSSISTEYLGLPDALPVDDMATMMALCSSAISKYFPNLAYKVPSWERNSDKKTIPLMDAGLDYNLPFPLLKEFHPDLILCLDVSHAKFPGEELFKACKKNPWLPKITKANRNAIAEKRPCLIKGRRVSILYIPIVENNWSTFDFHPKSSYMKEMRRILDNQWVTTKKILRNYLYDFGGARRGGDDSMFSSFFGLFK